MNDGYMAKQNPSETGFFTAGIGDISADQNPLPDTSNLEADTFVTDQPNSIINSNQIGSIDPSSLGSAALNSGNALPDARESYTAFREVSSNPELGQVIELSMPPLVGGSREQVQTDNKNIDTASIAKHFADERISKSDIDYIKTQEAKLAQDGNAADFYDFWQTARLDATSSSVGEESI